jgi:hypothetical protein
MEIEEQDFIEKISEFYHNNMCVWINTVLDLYGNVISKVNNPVTQIHMDDWRIPVTKQYKDLSEGEKEFYRQRLDGFGISTLGLTKLELDSIIMV